MDITIAIPTKNAEKFLLATLASLQSLRKQGAKVILADSFSTDGTLVIAQPLVDQIVSVPPGSMYRAVNSALRGAQTEWLTYINADDVLFSENVVAGHKACPADCSILYGNVDFIGESGCFLHSWKTPEPARLWPLFSGGFMGFSQPGTIFRREVFAKLNGFDEGFSHSADFDFYLRAMGQGFKPFKYPAPFAAFRIHSSQFSQHYAKVQSEECQAAVARIASPVSAFQHKAALYRLRLTNWHSYLLRFWRGSQVSGGALRLSKCLEIRPGG